MNPQHCSLHWNGRPIDIEYAWVGTEHPDAPCLVFLHEGLGSLSLWRDFPARLCATLGWCGLVYSRPGYGGSTPRAASERWQPDFMHRQALEVLPALLRTLGLYGPDTPPTWLFGHSDGGSIALIHAALAPSLGHPGPTGLVVVAPHVMVEDVTVASIERTRQAYRDGALRERLQRHHRDVDSAFWGWADVWLDPAFRAWDIRPLLPHLTCPVLAIQGLADEYGTLAQIEAIAGAAPDVSLCTLPGCGHSPQRERPEVLIALVAGWLRARAHHTPR